MRTYQNRWYGISGNGATLVAHDEFVGGGGNGTLIQDGGSNTVMGQLQIGFASTADGTYGFQAGTLSAFDLTIGTGGAGKLIQSGGTLMVAHLLAVNGDPANGRRTSFELRDGSVVASALLNKDTFLQTGGSAIVGPVSGSGTLTVSGGTFLASQISQRTLAIGSTGAVVLMPGSRPNAQINTLSGLHFDAAAQPGNFTGSLDLSNNTLLINYGSGASPDAVVRDYLISGTRSFDHSGITSSTVAADPRHYALGYADGGDGEVVGLGTGQELVKFTLMGDVNLDGAVGFADLLVLAQHYGLGSGGKWDQGDFNYDGSVNFADLLPLAQNYGRRLLFK